MIRKHLRFGTSVLLGMALLIVACKKNVTGPSASNKETILTAKAWHLQTATFSSGSIADSSFYTPDMANDSVAFNANNDYTFSAGGSATDSAFIPYGSGTWAFNTGQDSLLLKNGSGMTSSWQISSLTDSTLQVSYADSLNHQAATVSLSFGNK